jgi:hypothetical protein
MKTFQEFITEAKKIKILRTAHYTTPEGRDKILQQGFKPQGTGKYHPRDDDGNKYSTVYTTPSSRVGSDYGNARVNLKLVNPRVHTTAISGSEHHKKFKTSSDDEKKKLINPIDDSSDAIKKGSKVTRVKDAHQPGYISGEARGSYVMVDRETANKSIDKNPPPTLKAKSKPRRVQTQPKKK